MPDAAPRAYTLVLDWLEERLRDGDVRVGDKLPGERALAEQFGISRTSVREATRILDAMGLVRSSTGSGPASGAVVVSEPSAALGWALRMHVATQALPVADIVSTRVLLETESARLAAACAGATADGQELLGDDVPANADATGRRRQDLLAQAGALLDRMDDPDLPHEVFHELDAQFHILLAGLSGNVVMETMMTSLREAVIGYVQEAISSRADWPTVRDGLQRDHRRILAATRAGDGEAAATALREHILGFHALAAAATA